MTLDIEGVLAGHERRWRGAWLHCSEACGWTAGNGATIDHLQIAEHRAHIAAVLREQVARPAQAEAWSEGYHHGVNDMTDTETLTVVRRNPYRAAS